MSPSQQPASHTLNQEHSTLLAETLARLRETLRGQTGEQTAASAAIREQLHRLVYLNVILDRAELTALIEAAERVIGEIMEAGNQIPQQSIDYMLELITAAERIAQNTSGPSYFSASLSFVEDFRQAVSEIDDAAVHLPQLHRLRDMLQVLGRGASFFRAEDLEIAIRAALHDVNRAISGPEDAAPNVAQLELIANRMHELFDDAARSFNSLPH